MIAPGSIISCVVSSRRANKRDVCRSTVTSVRKFTPRHLSFPVNRLFLPDARFEPRLLSCGLVYSANHVHPHDHVERRWSIVDSFSRSFRCLVCTRTSYFHGITKIVHDSLHDRLANRLNSLRLVANECPRSAEFPVNDGNLFGRINRNWEY